jgi:type I restriction-modification system DNA methylase subunit
MNSNAQLSEQTESPRSFLKEAYKSLGYQDGVLLNAVILPNSIIETEEWLEKGDWLALAKNVGAEKIFFVNNDPVVVFCGFQSFPSDKELLNTFIRIWCMARPQCLFMALPGELRVYSLNQPPAKNAEDWRKIKPLEIVRRVAEVADKLRDYRREQIESGRLFADGRFGDINERADKRLIQDLKSVRQSLLTAGLNQQYVRYAHALIGRSIFIRYLEDREVLTPSYFDKVAMQNPAWQKIVSQEPEKPDVMLDWQKRRYDRVLRDKNFTYALFKQLAEDFNGDMFPRDEIEEKVVNQTHLDLLRGFLLGDVNPLQPNLFFWAYDFKIIPIELISSIYEEFYHVNNNEDDKGTHYTPSILVEYVLSQMLTEEHLASNPRILDPACGSGIFLVESFRRIVRYQVKQQGRILTSNELRQILGNQIAGIEINEEAVRIAAFSLYLALLHYQEPPDILKNKRLPNLIYLEGKSQNEDQYHILFKQNTFDLMSSERERLEGMLTTSKRFKGRTIVERLFNFSGVLPLRPLSFDIIVGNPPWGFEEGTTPEIRETQKQAQNWCKVFGWSIGDKEFSQAFIARTLNLLKPGGECGLLVSTGIFFKHHENSQKFRRRWLEECTIKTVVNFAHVRHSFFSAVAPFAFVHYKASPADSMQQIRYWSAKKTEIIDKIQAVVLTQSDIRQVKQYDLRYNDALWKVYWWGSHRDAALIKALKLDKTLAELKDKRGWPNPGRGFEGDFPTGDHNPSGWLKEYSELPVKLFYRYGLVSETDLVSVPELVHRRGNRDIYSGWRLLVKRGITQADDVNGQIEARLDNISYCFRNSIHGISLVDAQEWERDVLIGILWSSLARYYFFMTTSSWGTWHHEIHLEEVLDLPIRFPNDPDLREKIVQIVDKLRKWIPDAYSLWENLSDQKSQLTKLERELDEAIFDLYELIEPERDLIRDMCEFGLDFFYKHKESDAVKFVTGCPLNPIGVANNLPTNRREERGLEGYLYAFLQLWNRELEPEGELCWRIIRPPNVPMLAVIFTTQEKGDALPAILSTDEEEWVNVLKRCDAALLQPVSRSIYIDGMVRAVTDTEIFILKRNERRLWTRSTAREDAEAMLLQALNMQSKYSYGSSS